MENVEKVLEYINEQTLIECREIVQHAKDECEGIRAMYFRDEQDEYWKAINAGSKESELRLRSLNALAADEAHKQLEALRQEMLNEALVLAAQKLRELPDGEYKRILQNAGADTGLSAEEFVFSYRDELSSSVITALFE